VHVAIGGRAHTIHGEISMRSKMLAVAIAASLGLVSFTAVAQTTGKSPVRHRASSTAAPAVSAEDIAALKAQIAALQAKVTSLEERENAQSDINVSTAQAVEATQKQVAVAATKPVSADKIAYKGVNITLGGFLEAASIFRSRNEGADIASNYSAIPFKNASTANTHETRLSERQSRFSLLAEGDVSDNIHAAGYYEADFLGGAQTANQNESNSFNPRTRNVYLTIDWKAQGLHLLAGQNWSLLTLNSKGIIPRSELTPPQIDAQYIPGFAWARQAQIRLVKDWNQQYWFGLSLENPQTTFASGGAASTPGTTVIAGGTGFDKANNLSLNHIPDVVAKFAMDPGWGHYELFAVGRAYYNRFGGSNHNVYGGGWGLGAILPLIPKELEFQFSGMTGRGIGRYGSAQMPDVTARPDGSLAPIKENMVLAGLTYHPSSDWDIYLFGGSEKQDKEAFTADGKAYGWGNPLYDNSGCNVADSSLACVGNSKQIWQGTLGFWWKFYQGKFGKLQFGTQYSYTERKAFSGIGGAPTAKENMIFTSFRYYPF
jgi:hypothetical protein